MARHLMIGNDAAVSYNASTGVLANKAVDIQKLSSDGPTSLLPGDTIADSEAIRVVQGNGTTNIVSPWIYGKDVIAWGGKSGAAQTAEKMSVTFTTSNGAAIANYTLKIINLTNGEEPFNFKTYEVEIAASASVTTIAAAFVTAINADPAHWMKVTTPASNASGELTIEGLKKGDTKADGSVQEELVHMDAAFETDVATAATTAAVTYSGSNAVTGSRGVGDFFYIDEMEKELMGVQYGYYNRIHQPITPASTALSSVNGGAYDMYHIVATKDGSSHSQIHGVDNLIEIYIAMDNNTATITQALEGALNPYMNSAGFASVNL